ncbi:MULTISPECIES: FAD-dependent monooxygenase [Actinoalloteichus]|uniref:2-polyprenyl-6-methoxyphenol hydroxylase-like oxidoreductase n=1 Tax=Actinoalloteichus fjordicus TaxID=1612552 RepID=A0AAC9L960_9PSEU|nr:MULTISPECIES: FAD-dependent monooxygenase [Actinoalloteichus]APU13216.1 2-polyprenyl-6-methoxyphenol hydroxylase-like oxidoreductase [Actinoalloteichus fjordicus]APU19167.1 2-polyprenyl-6-methoxyphenol hydroxylase-like oxidoreductase [Actinoalloteichus sp. GBA129-24]
MTENEVEVLIVGGGPVGLATSIELSRHGVSSLLVEKHEGTSIFPKARLVSTRTMEIVRSWGVQSAVEEAGLPRDDSLALGIGPTLTSPDFRREVARIHEDAPQSPTYNYICAQDGFEVILRELAESLPGGEVRFATRMTRLAVDDDGVTATIADADGERQVRARYVVAADGSRSGVRESLGVAVTGPPPLSHMVSVLFDADLGTLLHDRLGALYFVYGEVYCAVESVDNRRRWTLQTGYEPDQGESASDFTHESCIELVRAAVGVADLPVRIVGMLPWIQQAVVAEEFRSGRVFLVGDAAHVATPQGGFGMNCGIQDAHNLAWKLASVLRGEAGDALLDTYSTERRPVADWTVQESLRNALITIDMMEDRLTMQEAGDLQAHRRRAEGLVLGYRYESPAVIADGTQAPAPEDPYETYLPTARPGHRAPHVWLSHRGRQVSTLDLLGTSLTLLSPAGSGWDVAAAQAADRLDVPLDVLLISPDDPAFPTSPTWAKEYGLTDTGAVLIRPDGHVAWRCAEGVPAADDLVKAVDAVLCRG